MSWTRAVLVLLALATGSLAADRPNVLVILADDQGWGDLSIHGNTNLRTPHIDSIARDGALFDRFFVCPVCSPTRAEFLTGRYHPRCGVRNVTMGGERLNLDEKTIADVFQSAGYATGAFGKWHNGTQYPYHPNGRGFQEYYGFTSGHWGDYFDPPLDHNGKTVKGKGYITDDLTDHALAFMGKNTQKPFFCYVAYNTPHSPMQVPDRFYDPFKNADLKLRYHGPQKEDLVHTRAALAMCENIDWNVGRLLAGLQQRKLAENTIVVYFSDNGPNGWRWNGGMRGRKGTTDEGGVRSPLLVRWPGHVPSGKRIASISAAIDLLPTLSDLAQINQAVTKPLDGVSMAPVLLGRQAQMAGRVLFSHWNGQVSARSQRYRLDASGKLYDMEADPGQAVDVSDEKQDEARRLQSAVSDWKRLVLSELPKKDDRPFPVGYRAFPSTTLPARDGVASGKIERSGRAPNCSFYRNWTTLADRITWDVEVETAGNYELAAEYACPESDIGSEIDITFQSAKLAVKVTEVHDPKLRGMENDRHPRGAGESFVKDWRAIALGQVELPKGRGTLAMQATKIPGKQVMELRSLILTLKN